MTDYERQNEWREAQKSRNEVRETEESECVLKK